MEGPHEGTEKEMQQPVPGETTLDLPAELIRQAAARAAETPAAPAEEPPAEAPQPVPAEEGSAEASQTQPKTPEEEPVGTTTLDLPAELIRQAAEATEKPAEGAEAPAQEPASPAEEAAPTPAPRRRAGLIAGSAAGLALLAGVVAGMLCLGTPAAAPQSEVPEPSPTPVPTAAPTPAPTPDPVAEAFAATKAICTGSAPQMTDPATWNEAGRALMERLEADPYYQEYGFTAAAAEAPAHALATVEALRTAAKSSLPAWTRSTPGWKDELARVDEAAAGGYPYLLAVNRAASTVTVYTTDADGRYTVPYMAMVCSGGEGTPTGYWSTPIRHNWRLLEGPCYGQYATRIFKGYLFHSVPYYHEHKDDLEYDQFNQLGTPASLGCIRLAVVDVKWIYDNCPAGTPVVIYDDAEDPGPMGKPGTIRTDPADEALRGWDPTDPDPQNPWPAEYRCGTAIRSLDAWAEYNAAVADGRWNATINETDLQGWSTDSSKEGTRG